MRPRPRIDVSALPTMAYGPRSTLWWGVVSMLAIETTMFALLFATYFYLRGNESIWPPPGGAPPFGPATACLVLLFLSVPPMVMVHRESGRERSLRKIRFWLIISMAIGLVALAFRAAEIAALPFRWDHHAYGSIVWVTIGMHAIHLLTPGGENILFIALLFKGPVEDRHLVDLRLNALYWYVVVVWDVMVYALIYLDPGVLRS